MNIWFILGMLASCGLLVATFMVFTSIMYYRRYQDNGAYRLAKEKCVRVMIVLLVLTVVMSIGTYFAATNCPECGKVAMDTYCEYCGAVVEDNIYHCPQCGEVAYHNFCGNCGYQMKGE